MLLKLLFILLSSCCSEPQKVDEMRARYEAMAGDKESAALAMLPDGAQSALCVVS